MCVTKKKSISLPRVINLPTQAVQTGTGKIETRNGFWVSVSPEIPWACLLTERDDNVGCGHAHRLMHAGQAWWRATRLDRLTEIPPSTFFLSHCRGGREDNAVSESYWGLNIQLHPESSMDCNATLSSPTHSDRQGSLLGAFCGYILGYLSVLCINFLVVLAFFF